jgi:hypothetical protein
MWEDNFKKIVNEKKMYEEEVNLGATKEEVEKFISEVRKEIDKEIPKEYLNIIERVNGIEFNGFILYGIDEYLLENEPKQHIYGLTGLNQIWYENEEQKQYLFLGESNISWYVYKCDDRSFIELDNPSGREINKFFKFEDMFEKLLLDALS